MALWLPRATLLVLLGAWTAESHAAPSKKAEEIEAQVSAQLELTRAAAELGAARASLARERETLAYAQGLLDHRGRESLRRLSSYRAARGARETQARKRARVLYKLARGGLPRLYFEKLDAEVQGDDNADRITRGRSVRWLVRHDLRELEVHRRAESGAGAELLAASREFAAISALRMVQGMQDLATEEFEAAVTPQLLATVSRNRRAARRGKLSREAKRSWSQAKKEFRALKRERGFDLLEPKSLPRPVKGPIVGRFGKHVDRRLRIEFERKGIELDSRPGAEVRSIADGRVAFVGALPGFDQVVVVDHGGGYLTLTGRLLDLGVEEGQEIVQGQSIGRAAPAEADRALGTTVYLELRHGERPIDPAPYLRRRGR
jgi:murein DD-endopeptidase MepM/ murein hydrolase activator NlpD